MLREKAKLTIEEAADSLEVSISTIYKYEDGSRTPLVADFPRIAELYRVKRFKDLLPDD
jgi:transcriptional regulator with XRE-family HTH domain